MPRIYNATFLPFTYEELATPLMQATTAHQLIEEDYNNNMLIVDSLRQRALSELEKNPDSKWANNIIDYANNLEAYATDLARNGLSRQTKINLLDAKRGFGTTVVPVVTAMNRLKDLQSVRDKQLGTGVVFGRMPTIDEIIDNPNIGQSSYDKNELYKIAFDTAKKMSERNIEVFNPRNISDYMYVYGTKKGFSNEDIQAMLNNDPGFEKMFSNIVAQSGYLEDSSLLPEQKSELNNIITIGALNGFEYDLDMKYGNRNDTPYEKLRYRNLLNEYNDKNNGGYGDYGAFGLIPKRTGGFLTIEKKPSADEKHKGIAFKNTAVAIPIEKGTQEKVKEKYSQDSDNSIILSEEDGKYFSRKNGDHIDLKNCNPVGIEFDNSYIDNFESESIRVVWRDKDGKEYYTKYFNPDYAKSLLKQYLDGPYKLADKYYRTKELQGNVEKEKLRDNLAYINDDILGSIGTDKTKILEDSKNLDDIEFADYMNNIMRLYYLTYYYYLKQEGANELILLNLLSQQLNRIGLINGYTSIENNINEAIENMLYDALSTAAFTVLVLPRKIE